MGQNQHVVPHGDGWAVRGAGNERVTSTHSTQAEAQAADREAATPRLPLQSWSSRRTSAATCLCAVWGAPGPVFPEGGEA